MCSRRQRPSQRRDTIACYISPRAFLQWQSESPFRIKDFPIWEFLTTMGRVIPISGSESMVGDPGYCRRRPMTHIHSLAGNQGLYQRFPDHEGKTG